MISVLLPISDKEDPKLIELCLKSLANQTYKDFEVLIVMSKSSAKKNSRITKKYPFVKVLRKDLNKTAARNFAAKHTKGEYLLHLDADMELPAQVLSKCVEKTAEAIIVPLEEAPRPNFWSRCRAFEKNLFLGGSAAESPIFIKRSLFEKIGGYDEDLDPLDDWDLHLALKALGVKFKRIETSVLVRESTNFKEMLRRKYERGRAFSAFREKHPHPPQLNLKVRLGDYFRNWEKLIRSPHLSLGLFALKIGDITSFLWGTLYPKRPGGSEENPYMSSKVAKEYTQRRLGNNFGRYKHYRETNSLLKFLGPPSGKILELGTGTGRITAELVKRGYNITPTDISEPMLHEFKKKKELPKPILIKGAVLPFSDDQFDYVIAIRVIWHIMGKREREKFLEEAVRVAKKSVVLDFTSDKRYKNPLLKPVLQRLQPSFFENSYFFSLEEIKELTTAFEAKVEKLIPLDVLTPLWLNLLPSRLAKPLFPILSHSEKIVARILPPGRFMVKILPPSRP